MSKIGKQPIKLPDGVTVALEGTNVKVQGPKGTLEKKFANSVAFENKDGSVIVTARRSDRGARAMHGTARAIVANMVKGVSEGWERALELVGTGYRAEVQGNTLVLTVGYIHPVRIEAPNGVSFKVEKSDITVSGADKEAVGQVAALIRGSRPPEPYQGKGVRYKDEVVRRKAGKAAKGESA